MGLFSREACPQEPGSVAMTAGELVERTASGERFRLAALLYTRPTFVPDKVGGQWPLVTAACRVAGEAGPPILIAAQCEPYRTPGGALEDSEGHMAYPGDRLAVAPAEPQ